MKNSILILLIALSFNVSASEKMTITVGKSSITMSKSKKGGWLSENCDSQAGCMAGLAAKNTRFADLPKGWGVGGVNPGSPLCRHSAKGAVLMGFDPKGNQIAVCRFKDGSFTTLGSLTLWASQKNR